MLYYPVQCIVYHSVGYYDHWLGLVGPADFNACGAALYEDVCKATWTWYDGNPMANANGSLVYDHWRSGRPNSDTGCASMSYTNGDWVDQSCDISDRYVCKRGGAMLTLCPCSFSSSLHVLVSTARPT